MNKIRIYALAVLAMAAFESSAACYSEGVRVGTVQKYSTKGLISKSGEGELVMEGTKIVGTTNGVRGGNVWKFSVLDMNVSKVIDEAVMTGSPIALKYCEASPLDLTKSFITSTPYRITQAVIRK